MINYLRRNTCALLAGGAGAIALDIDGEWTSELISLVLVVIAIVLGIIQGEQDERRRHHKRIQMQVLRGELPASVHEQLDRAREEARRRGSR